MADSFKRRVVEATANEHQRNAERIYERKLAHVNPIVVRCKDNVRRIAYPSADDKFVCYYVRDKQLYVLCEIFDCKGRSLNASTINLRLQ